MIIKNVLHVLFICVLFLKTHFSFTSASIVSMFFFLFSGNARIACDNSAGNNKFRMFFLHSGHDKSKYTFSYI
mgnify:CR=1 FL=1